MKKPKLTKPQEEILKKFQTPEIRHSEEMFAQIVSKKDNVRLFFINENQAYTDGKNIVVDPAVNYTFIDTEALKDAENFLGIENRFSSDMWNTLSFITHAQTLHESLHIVYTKFPSYTYGNPKFNTEFKQFVMHNIENTIEDAFIENAGATLYDNMAFFLKAGRVLSAFSNFNAESTFEFRYKEMTGESLEDSMKDAKSIIKKIETPENAGLELTADERSILERAMKIEALMDFLHYTAAMILLPFFKIPKPDGMCKPYIEKSRDLFYTGTICGDAKERCKICEQIYDIVKDLIPEDESIPIPNDTVLKKIFMNSTGTHDDSHEPTEKNEPETIQITKKLFGDSPKSSDNKLSEKEKQLLDSYVDSQKISKDLSDSQVTNNQPQVHDISSAKYDCAGIHKGIKIEQIKPATDTNLLRAYKNVVEKFALSINTWSRRFERLLKAAIDESIENQIVGSSIVTSKLGDVKKRYWQRIVRGEGIPELAILILIDGSGSMEGDRQNAAINSSIILHEVLGKQKIEHCVVEHRAIFGKPLVQHRVLLDFNARDLDKLNLLLLDADEGTREGLSLYWAEKYLQENSTAENKLLIVISDGEPCHVADDDVEYSEAVAVKDTANAAKKIINRGTKIVGLAIDDPNSDACYQALKQIYPDTVPCTDLSKMTGEILKIISRQFR